MNKQIVIRKVQDALGGEFKSQTNTPFMRERATDFVMDVLKKVIHDKGYFNVQCNEENNPPSATGRHRLVVNFSYMAGLRHDMVSGRAVVALKEVKSPSNRLKSFIKK